MIPKAFWHSVFQALHLFHQNFFSEAGGVKIWDIFQVCFVDLQGSGRHFVGCANVWLHFHPEQVCLRVIWMRKLSLGCLTHRVARWACHAYCSGTDGFSSSLRSVEDDPGMARWAVKKPFPAPATNVCLSALCALCYQNNVQKLIGYRNKTLPVFPDPWFWMLEFIILLSLLFLLISFLK